LLRTTDNDSKLIGKEILDSYFKSNDRWEAIMKLDPIDRQELTRFMTEN
jgi:hypothetical protein